MKLCNASADTKTADINLSRFKGVKTAVKTTLTGQPEDENNYEKQPIGSKDGDGQDAEEDVTRAWLPTPL